MAKKSAILRNQKVIKKIASAQEKRARLKKIIQDKTKPASERFEAQLRLAKLPRTSSKVRARNRCEITGRPRAYYRKFKMSRIALRDLASAGLVPGVTKSSW